jgi:hypothetical protein
MGHRRGGGRGGGGGGGGGVGKQATSAMVWGDGRCVGGNDV